MVEKFPQKTSDIKLNNNHGHFLKTRSGKDYNTVTLEMIRQRFATLNMEDTCENAVQILKQLEERSINMSVWHGHSNIHNHS